MIALGAVIIQAAACFGLGIILLRLLKTHEFLSFGEKICFSFSLGFGILGWVLFFFGILNWFDATPILILFIFGIFGNYYFYENIKIIWRNASLPKLTSWELIIVFGIMVALAFDLFEGLSPPADADTLAYHFDIPKRFILAGEIYFIPRAVEAASPLLIQTTYIPFLAFGSERALTLWTMLSGWMAAALLFVLSRRYLDLK